MRQWIMWCVTITSVSIIINDNPTILSKSKEAENKETLLYLFFSIASLNYVSKEACANSVIVGVHIGVDNIKLTHLQYVGDRLVDTLILFQMIKR